MCGRELYKLPHVADLWFGKVSQEVLEILVRSTSKLFYSLHNCSGRLCIVRFGMHILIAEMVQIRTESIIL